MPILMNLNELMVTFSASMKPTMILVLVLSTAVVQWSWPCHAYLPCSVTMDNKNEVYL
jgi:hypothetical protein